MLTRYAIIDGINVVNVIEYENPPGNPPPGFPDNFIAVQSDVAGPGWLYENGVFIDPTPPSPPRPQPTDEQLAGIN
jgi:hypothetical protein